MIRILLAAVTALVVLIPGAAPALAAGGVSTSAASTYQVVPKDGLIRVTVKQKISNTLSNASRTYGCPIRYRDPYFGWITVRGTCTQTTYYYVNETVLWVEDRAKGLKVTSDAGSVKVTRGKRTNGYRSYTIRYPRILRGQTRTITARYVLPGGKPRSSSTDGINGAYMNFSAISQPTDRATLTVTIPKSFDIDTYGAAISKRVKGGSHLLTSGNIKDPASYIVGVTGTNEAGLTEQRVTTEGGRTIAIRGWPGDDAWMQAVRAEVEASIPKLERLIGQPLPGEGEIVVREVASGQLGDAYIAAYDESDQVAHVSEDFSQAGVVTHEISHAWFNDALFDREWLSEGYAGWIERATGEVAEECTAPRYPGKGKPDLDSWQFASPRATAEELSIVGFQYDAACAVVSTVARQIGADRMREVIQVLSTPEGAYEGVDDARPGKPATWRDWLDAVDERGMRPAGLDHTHAVGLMLARFGIANAAELRPRAEAREALDDLRATTGGWTVPAAITGQMAGWSFAAAQRAIDVAEETYRLAQEVERTLPSIDADASSIRSQYEDATAAQDLDAAKDTAAEQLEAARRVADAQAEAGRERGPLEELGLLGTDVPGLSSGAVAAVAAMDLASATSAASEIQALMDSAMTTGLLRAGAIATAVVALLVLLVLAWVLLRRRRRARLPEP